MKATIGIDTSPLTRDVYTGTEWYTYNLIKGLSYLEEANQYKFVLYMPSKSKKNLNLPDNFQIKILRWPLGRLWISVRLSIEMLLNPPTYLFVPANNLPKICPKKTITTIHDIGFLLFPELYTKSSLDSLNRGLILLSEKASKILAISKTVRQNISDYYKSIEDRVRTVSLAIDNLNLEKMSKTKPRIIKDNYILYIGTMNKKKNAKALIPIFDALVKNGFDKKLVLIGNSGNDSKNINTLIENSPYKENIIFKKWVSDVDHANFLLYADALMIPSKHEGFSLPILEAQSLNVPAIVSDIPIHREVAGLGAVYINTEQVDNSAHVIRNYLDNRTEIERQIDLGKKNCNRYSIMKMAKETLEEIVST